MKGIVMPVVELPSGLSGEVRRLKVKDENILTDRRSLRDGSATAKLIRSCWETTLDPGPYEFTNGFNVNVLLQGDKFELLRQLRLISYPGNEHYEFSVTCPNCQASFAWSVDLKDLEVKKLPLEVKEKIASNEPLEFVLPDCGKTIHYKLITSKDEERLAKAFRQSPDRISTVLLCNQIVAIEGEQHIASFVEDMSSYDATCLRREIEKNDCGVETTIGIECVDCFHVFNYDVPFGLNFILPTAKSGMS